MNHQQQLKVDNCGQTCIAIITGVTQYDAVGALGRDGATTTGEIKKTLWNFGYDCELRRGKKNWPPSLAVLFLRTEGAYLGHAVVLRDGVVHDPALREPMPLEYFEVFLRARRARIQSYLCITKRRI